MELLLPVSVLIFAFVYSFPLIGIPLVSIIIIFTYKEWIDTKEEDEKNMCDIKKQSLYYVYFGEPFAGKKDKILKYGHVASSYATGNSPYTLVGTMTYFRKKTFDIIDEQGNIVDNKNKIRILRYFYGDTVDQMNLSRGSITVDEVKRILTENNIEFVCFHEAFDIENLQDVKKRIGLDGCAVPTKRQFLKIIDLIGEQGFIYLMIQNGSYVATNRSDRLYLFPEISALTKNICETSYLYIERDVMGYNNNAFFSEGYNGCEKYTMFWKLPENF